MPSQTQREASQRWEPRGTGAWYDEKRWSNARRRERDPNQVRAILSRYSNPDELVLDVPCGTGRLAPAIEQFGPYVGLDASASMLDNARPKVTGNLMRADANRLPFASDSFPTVLCCRLLHHLKTCAELETTLGELMRVSSRTVAGSFWDANSLAALRRRLPFVRKPAHRGPFPKSWIETSVQKAGGEIVAWRHSARFFSQQTWFVARKR